MEERDDFLEELVGKINSMINSIEELELMESDLSVARELAEQLRDEVQSLQD
jgi:hypothetical protein